MPCVATERDPLPVKRALTPCQYAENPRVVKTAGISPRAHKPGACLPIDLRADEWPKECEGGSCGNCLDLSEVQAGL